MALYTQTATTDLTTKGKRLGSIHIASVAGATVSLKDGVGGTVRFQWVVAANSQKDVDYGMPSAPLFPNGIQVTLDAGSVQAITLDLY